MINPPKTYDEAKGYRYDKWVGNPNGTAYNPDLCAASVSDSTGWHFYQCSRKRGFGPACLYCKQHAKKLFGGQQ